MFMMCIEWKCDVYYLFVQVLDFIGISEVEYDVFCDVVFFLGCLLIFVMCSGG